MEQGIHHFIKKQASLRSDAIALIHGDLCYTYQALWNSVRQVATGLRSIGLSTGDRVAIFLPKTFEAVSTILGCSAAGVVFVPVNPILKPYQVIHILKHSGASALVTTSERAAQLEQIETNCPDLAQLIIAPSKTGSMTQTKGLNTIQWQSFLADISSEFDMNVQPDQLAALIYTSGSTGLPKGVMLSHANLAIGARSVVEYLGNNEEDKILALLPFSFDYGLSQLTTAFLAGASVVLLNYLFPKDVLNAVEKHSITGIAAIPTLWISLSKLDWSGTHTESIRYITNSGGALPAPVTRLLAKLMPTAEIFLMYGLTEAFRSTYLSPSLVDQFPESIGRPIPYTEIAVVNDQHNECMPMETGELVHAGPLVAQGYWQDQLSTSKCFRSVPAFFKDKGIAVWSGDQVYRDKNGLLYFVGRKDALIKTSGYRVSPSEIESILYQQAELSGIDEVIALGVPHPELGQAIILILARNQDQSTEDDIMGLCRRQLATYMLPKKIIFRDKLPTTANGKTDRVSLSQEYRNLFNTESL